MSTETVEAAETHIFPCSACGSDLRYAPGERFLKCDHCGNEDPLDPLSPWEAKAGVEEMDYGRAVSDQLDAAEMEETRVVGCSSCGAQVEFSAEEHAAECPFCASPLVTDTGTHRHIKPAGVLPFAFTEPEAHEAMTRWLGRLWFAPNGLKEYARHGRKLQGMYVPYWTFDAMTHTAYKGRRGTEHRRTVGQGENRRTEVTVRWRNVAGQVARHFDDVLILGSRSLPADKTDGLAPWDLSMLEPYRPEFLAGFRAEGYTIELEEGFREAGQVMERVIVRDIRFDIGGDRQQITEKRTQMSDVTFKHILLPVWMAAYRYRGKSYRFIVNGRTGRVQGERPWSAWKIAVAVVLAALVAGAIGFVIAMEQNGGF
ncbi:MAG: primosomal protein N' (replication factor Y) - superfamily II helicase [Pseudomonadota bacterium]